MTMPTPAEEYERVFVPAMFGPCRDLLFAHVPPRPGNRVLDLACGTGVVARGAAAAVGSEGSVTAIDLRPGMLAAAEALPAPPGASVVWRQGDAAALQLADASFDVVYCQQGLQFFPDRPGAMTEMARVLAPGGRVGLAVWRGLARLEVMAALCAAEVRHLGALGVTQEDSEAPFSLDDAAELAGLLRGAGFRDVRVTEETLTADYAADTFVRDCEYAYAAVMPQFQTDPARFEHIVKLMEADIAPVLARYRRGDRLVFPMALHIAVATR